MLSIVKMFYLMTAKNFINDFTNEYQYGKLPPVAKSHLGGCHTSFAPLKSFQVPLFLEDSATTIVHITHHTSLCSNYSLPLHLLATKTNKGIRS